MQINVTNRLIDASTLRNNPIAFSGDNMIDIIEFCIPKMYNGIDLSTLEAKLDVENDDELHTKGVVALDKTVKLDKLILKWTIKEKDISNCKKNVYIQIRLIEPSGSTEDENKVKWHSNRVAVIIGESINAVNSFPSPLPSEFEDFENRMANIQTDVTAKCATVVNLADTFVNTTLPEAIQQVADAGAEQVALATEQADRAKAERERVEAIDVYTKGESDSRYLRATEIRRPFTGGGITLTDADDAAFSGVTVLGATTETGTGGKGPDNPYALTGVQPASLTVCGRNMIPYPYTSLPSAVTGISFADNGDGTITVNGTAEDETAGRLHFLSNLLHLPAGTYTLSGCAANGSGNTWCLQVVRVINGVEDWGWLCREFGTGITFTLTEATDIYIRIRLKKGTVINNGIFKPQLEFGTAATPYTPYTGQTVPLPALEPLYGTGTVNDEYDAVTGVETRRWKRVVFDGTESMRCEAHGNGQRYVSIDLDAAANKSVMPISTHYTSSAWTQDNNKVYIPNPVVMVITDSRFTTLQAARDILAAQYAAGTPVTVVYQLAEPVITQHDPARILPPAPVCRVFADAGNTAVGYNRDINRVVAKLEAALTSAGV